MKLKANHIPYVANKIALDLANSSLLELNTTLEKVAAIASEILDEDIRVESALDSKTREIMEDRASDIEFLRINEKQFFWMIKKELAQANNINLDWEDRYSEISHRLLDRLINEDIIIIKVRENQVKNLIFKAIDNYVSAYNEVEELIVEKIKGYKRKLIVGTDEYEIVFNKLYEEELKNRGF